jgi:WD40 repeat protein
MHGYIRLSIFIVSIVFLHSFISCEEYTPPPEHIITYTVQNRSNFGDLEFSSDGSILASISRKRQTAEYYAIVLWDVDKNIELNIIGGFEWSKGLSSIAFSPNSNRIISGGGREGDIRVWSSADGIEEELIHNSGSFVYVKYSPDGRFIASADIDGNIILRDADNLEILWQREYRTGIHCLAFSPDSKLLFTGGISREVVPWKVSNGEPLSGYENVHDPVAGILFYNDGESFLTYDGGYENSVKLWKYPSGELIQCIEFGENTIYGAALHPEEDVAVLVGHKYYIALLDLTKGEIIKEIQNNFYDNFDVCFSPDGKTFAVSGQYGVSLFKYDLNE